MSEGSISNWSLQGAGYKFLQLDKSTKILLERGADINVTYEYGDTPLLSACKNAMLSVALVFVKRGYDICSKDSDGMCAIDLYGDDRPEELDEDGIDIYREEEAQSRVLPLSEKVQHIQIIISAFGIEENWRRRKAFMMCLSGSGYMSYPSGEFSCSRDRVLFDRDLSICIMSYL
jgi:hypothetical protein